MSSQSLPSSSSSSSSTAAAAAAAAAAEITLIVTSLSGRYLCQFLINDPDSSDLTGGNCRPAVGVRLRYERSRSRYQQQRC